MPQEQRRFPRFEYGGPGVRTLDVPDRATVTNMGAECGVTSSVFPSDSKTKSFMTAQDRVDQWRELTADPDAEYERIEEVDLSEIEPLAAAPHSPGNVVKCSPGEDLSRASRKTPHNPMSG